MTRDISRPSTALLSEAVSWFNERLSGDMSPDDELRFNEWLGRSLAHEKAYQTVDRGWTIAGALTPINSDIIPLKPRSKPFRWLVGGAIAASLMLGASLSFNASHPFIGTEEVKTVQNFETTTGQRSVITLPDGTKVTLDSETILRFSDLKKERRVDLVQGRAYFDVAHNSARPFIVHADHKKIMAIGTMFEVSMNGKDIAVVLAEGKVRVEDTRRRGSADLVPGRQLVMHADRHWTLRNVDVKKETSWTNGRLIFMSDPLAQAVLEVNRYSKRKITFEGGAIPSKEIVGIFSAGDVDSFVTALEMNGIAHKVTSTHDQLILKGEEL